MSKRRTPRGMSLAQRLAFHSRPTSNGCREWTASNKLGYGQLRVNGKLRQAHRLAWEVVNGPIPDGLCVCHSCDNPPCINDAHLFLGTKTENNADRDAKGRGRGAGPPGERQGNAKLTGGQVLAIRADQRLLREIAADYGLAESHVSAIRLRKSWRHI